STIRRSYRIGAAPVEVALLGQTPWVAARTPAGREHRGGTLRVSYASFDALDPAFSDNVHPAIWRATGDELVALARTSGTAQLVPDLAMTVPVPTDNGLTYTFTLRSGLRYSTGVPVMASDFRRGFERLFATRSPDAGVYSALRGADACLRLPKACDLSEG